MTDRQRHALGDPYYHDDGAALHLAFINAGTAETWCGIYLAPAAVIGLRPLAVYTGRPPSPRCLDCRKARDAARAATRPVRLAELPA